MFITLDFNDPTNMLNCVNLCLVQVFWNGTSVRILYTPIRYSEARIMDLFILIFTLLLRWPTSRQPLDFWTSHTHTLNLLPPRVLYRRLISPSPLSSRLARPQFKSHSPTHTLILDPPYLLLSLSLLIIPP